MPPKLITNIPPPKPPIISAAVKAGAAPKASGDIGSGGSSGTNSNTSLNIMNTPINIKQPPKKTGSVVQAKRQIRSNSAMYLALPCRGISEGNYGSILSFVVRSMRSSATELETIAHTTGSGMLTAFPNSKFHGKKDFVIPQGGLVPRKLHDGSGYAVFSENCTGVATPFLSTQPARVARCIECRKANDRGRKYINKTHKPVFLPPSDRSPLDFITNDPKSADYEIRRLRKDLREERRKNAEIVQSMASLQRQAQHVPREDAGISARSAKKPKKEYEC